MKIHLEPHRQQQLNMFKNFYLETQLLLNLLYVNVTP